MNNDKRKEIPAIKTWEEFETEVWKLHSRRDERKISKESARKFEEEVWSLRSRYLNGSGKDNVERRLRWKQIQVLKMDDLPYIFFCTERNFVEDRLSRAKSIDRKSVEEELEKEKQLKEHLEEQEKQKQQP